MNAKSQTQFNDAYWLAEDPRIAALRPYQQDPIRVTKAFELALGGLLIDNELDALGWDPYTVMSDRIANGYYDPATGNGWYPNALQPPLLQAPNSGRPPTPGLPVYDPNKPPAGSIVVTLDLDKYPPFNPPAPPAPPVTIVSLVGRATGAMWGEPGQLRPSYLIAGYVGLNDGDLYTDPLGRGVFTFHKIPAMGSYAYAEFFTLNRPG